ncbi:hypothetical protein EDD11_003244 [Mortierella claussenii]|nr:hypothetical protein EDD11_003244 [Mortierella claussenii]
MDVQGGGRDGDNVEMSDSVHGRAVLMRSLLRPKPVPGVENCGIPPAPEGEVNPDVQMKMEQYQHVKQTRGITFNQSLMRNKNFRNPHIYATLVEVVALNETGSNFEKTKEFFDFEGYGVESYASGIAEAQKQAMEKIAHQQTAGARSHLQFVPGGGNVPGSGIGMPIGMPPIRPQSNAFQSTISSSTSGLVASAVASATAAAAALAAGSQRPRKSKWDVTQSGGDDSSGKRSRR